MKHFYLFTAIIVSFGLTCRSDAQLQFTSIATFNHVDPEINSFDSGTKRTFVTKAGTAELDVLNAAFGLDSTINVMADVAGVSELNSVATKNGIVAVAGKATVGTDPGFVAFYNANTLSFMGSVSVGANPDMLTFTPDGSRILVANEGEPSNDYTIDPVGSVSIIDVSGGANNSSPVSTAGFSAFNGSSIAGGRVFGPGATVAQDLEPEYIAVSADGTTAYVSLQENNAYATLDIASSTVTSVTGFGFKDHSLPGNGFDASNQDSLDGNIQNWDVLGMYQPDAVATYSVGGTNYLVTANEGDARDYGGFSEETRVRSLALDLNDNGIDDDIDDNGLADNSLAIFDDNTMLGRLKTTTATGDTDNDGLIETIFSYGGRSFSIFNADTGALVFDSGDDFEQMLINDFPGEWVDSRSDDKGPEPESVVLGEVFGETLAFVGLERTGGIMVYDVTDPNNPTFEQFLSLSEYGISSPEGLTFVSAADSQFGLATLLVSNEFEGSGNTQTIALTISAIPEPSFAVIGIASMLLLLGSRRRRRA